MVHDILLVQLRLFAMSQSMVSLGEAKFSAVPRGSHPSFVQITTSLFALGSIPSVPEILRWISRIIPTRPLVASSDVCEGSRGPAVGMQHMVSQQRRFCSWIFCVFESAEVTWPKFQKRDGRILLWVWSPKKLAPWFELSQIHCARANGWFGSWWPNMTEELSHSPMGSMVIPSQVVISCFNMFQLKITAVVQGCFRVMFPWTHDAQTKVTTSFTFFAVTPRNIPINTNGRYS